MNAPHSSAGSADGGIARALDRVTAGRAIPGNAVVPIDDGPDAFETMLRLIAEARQSVNLDNYMIRGDRVGRRFAEALGAAAKRGVAVRVLFDRLGSRRTPRRYWTGLRRDGVEVRGFGRFDPLRPVRIFRRDHRKYLGIDGTDAILGGMCIGDEWAGDAERGRPPWRDAAVYVAGPAVAPLELTFSSLWRLTGGSADTTHESVNPRPRGAAMVRVIEGEPGRLRLYRATELLAAAAAERLWITDAYLVPATPLFANLRAAARAGVDVRILVPGHTDIPAVRALTRAGYRELLRSGARIWEWHGPMLHAKTILVDQWWYKVGSSNLNPTSYLSNYELDVLVEDPGLCQAVAQGYRRDLSQAVEIVLRPRRGPRSLSARVPAAVAEADAIPKGPARALARGERTRRTVVALRKVAGGARRSLVGAFLFAVIGAGALFLAIPDVMAYVVAAGCFALAGLAIGRLIESRRDRDD